MQDIRKPYTRSRSNNDLQSRVEQFESARYRRDDDYYEEEPVQIPTKKTRRDVVDMDMYPRRRIRNEGYEEEVANDQDFDPPTSQRASRNRFDRQKNSLSTILFIGFTLLIVTAVILYTYVFDTATITIVPKYKDVTEINQALLFSKDGTDPNGIPFVIQTASVSKTKTLALSETRKVEGKASGKVIIYNNFDANAQKLIKNTRFESPKGKIYRINQSVEVPGKNGSTPGSVEVTLYADGSGETYNIDSATFSIPGFKGTPREQAFYAKSKGAISGGSSGTMSLVSLSELNAAKDSLAVELAKEVQTDVLKIKKDDYVPMTGAVDITYEDNEQEVLTGKTAVYKVTATGNMMLAKEAKLAEAIAKTFTDYDNSPVRLEYTDTLTFTKKSTDQIVGNSSSTLSILVEGKPRVIWNSDTDKIKEMVKGNKRDEFKPLMKLINSIESAEISFSPLWLTHFPDDFSKIKVIESLPKR